MSWWIRGRSLNPQASGLYSEVSRFRIWMVRLGHHDERCELCGRATLYDLCLVSCSLTQKGITLIPCSPLWSLTSLCQWCINNHSAPWYYFLLGWHFPYNFLFLLFSFYLVLSGLILSFQILSLVLYAYLPSMPFRCCFLTCVTNGLVPFPCFPFLVIWLSILFGSIPMVDMGSSTFW